MPKRKCYIGEADVTLLLKRYDVSTILSLLYEISKCASRRINWDDLVKETNTGIKNPREYQALWRRLAYRKELDPDGEDLPVQDDESDLELEVEPFPSVSTETATDASNYVKALMGYSTDIAFANADSASLSIFPGFSSAQMASLESFYKANSLQKKKQKLWTPEEDEELASGVEKYGEGNWASILKNAFKNDRTTSQLAHRWGLIKKKREIQQASVAQVKQMQQLSTEVDRKPKLPIDLPVCEQNGISMQPSTSKQGQSQQLRGDKSTVLPQRKPTIAANSRPSLVNTNTASAKPKPPSNTSPVVMNTQQQKPTPPPSLPQMSTPISIPPSPAGKNNSRTIPSPVSTGTRIVLGPDPMVQAAAVAAGARIASASVAATFIPIKAKKNKGNNNANTRTSPVVHYIRTGSAPPPILKKPGKAVKNNAAGNKTNVKPASRFSGAIVKEEIATDTEKRDKLALTKTKVMVSREAQMNSSWYELMDECTVVGSHMAVVDVESDTEEVPAFGGMVCTSSNESFSFGGGVTPNGASPLSHSSGQSD